jgi:hypothetical protein
MSDTFRLSSQTILQNELLRRIQWFEVNHSSAVLKVKRRVFDEYGGSTCLHMDLIVSTLYLDA